MTNTNVSFIQTKVTAIKLHGFNTKSDNKTNKNYTIMKHIKHLFTALLLLCCLTATAHDFEVDGIYYNITDATNKKVEVTHRGSHRQSYSNEYTGSVVIPESVTYNSSTYSVTSIGNYAFYDCTSLTLIVFRSPKQPKLFRNNQI